MDCGQIIVGPIIVTCKMSCRSVDVHINLVKIAPEKSLISVVNARD